MKKISAVFATAAAMLLFSGNAFAGDTTELLDQGVVEIVPVISLTNIHDGKPAFSSEVVLGFGVADFMTINAGLSAETAEGLADATFGFTLEAVFTPLDTEHFDIDFVADFNYAGGEYDITPSFELNYDSDNDMSFWGAYLRFGLPIFSGRSIDVDDEGVAAETKTDINFDLSLGFYISFVTDQQLVVEGGFTAVNLAENLGESEIEGGYVSLGYNFMIGDNLELTPELAINIPNKDSDEGVSATISIGGVFDMVKIHE